MVKTFNEPVTGYWSIRIFQGFLRVSPVRWTATHMNIQRRRSKHNFPSTRPVAFAANKNAPKSYLVQAQITIDHFWLTLGLTYMIMLFLPGCSVLFVTQIQGVTGYISPNFESAVEFETVEV